MHILELGRERAEDDARRHGQLAIEIGAIRECSDRTVPNSSRLADNDIDVSVGSKGDSPDSALVESFNVARTS